MSETLLTADEAATHLRLAKSTIYGLTHRRAIRHVKLGRSLRFRPSDLADFVERGIRETEEVPSVDIRR